MTHASIAPVTGQKSRMALYRFCLSVAFCLMVPALSAAQVYDPTGIKRCFLDRYLDCAEAPDAAARLECYDALLADIPAWLEARPHKGAHDGTLGSALSPSPRHATKEQCSPDEQD